MDRRSLHDWEFSWKGDPRKNPYKVYWPNNDLDEVVANMGTWGSRESIKPDPTATSARTNAVAATPSDKPVTREEFDALKREVDGLGKELRADQMTRNW